MSRKRAQTGTNKNKVVVQKKVIKANPLMKQEAAYFQNLVDASNRFTALKQQKAQYNFVIKKLEERRKQVQDGKIKMPVVMPLIPKVMYYQEFDKKEVLKLLDEQINSYKQNVLALQGQLEHREEDYQESAVRTREFMMKRYGELKAKTIGKSDQRGEIEDEDVLFEAEFKDFIDKPETKEKFNKAKQEAIRKNVTRQTKKGK